MPHKPVSLSLLPRSPFSLAWGCLCLAGLVVFSGCQSQPTSPPDKQVAELKAKLDALSQDWPNLSRYRAENAQLGRPAASESRVVFMGDSITDAWPRNTTFFRDNHFVGRGISGQTTPQMLARFREDVIDLEPKVVVILAGTNDIAGNTGPYNPEQTKGCLASMVELAQSHNIRVILSSVLPAFDYPWRPGLEPAEKIVALNTWIKAYAAKSHCVYLDYFGALAADNKGMRREYSGDGVHPNPKGYAVMEPLAAKAIDLARSE